MNQSKTFLHNKPCEEDLKNYGEDADFMATISESGIKGFLPKETDHTYAERIYVKVQKQIALTLVYMLLLVTSASSTWIKTASTGILGTIVIEQLRGGAADDGTLKWLVRWSRSDTINEAIV